MKETINIRFVILCSFAAALGGLLFGYDTAVINGANTNLQQFFGLTAENDSFLIGLATASAILGCIPGALCAGFVSDRIGRKKVLFLSAIMFSISALWSAFPGTFTLFIVARFIGGMGIGFASMVCPVYIAELAPPSWRGRLGALFQFGIVFGIFITLFINKLIQGVGDAMWNVEYGWRWMLGSELIPAGIFILLLSFIVESPKWLIQAGAVANAREILSKIGGRVYAENEITAVNETLQKEEGRFAELFSGRYRRPLIIAVFIMFACQLSGINAIMYYSTDIFKKATGDANAAYTCSVYVGLVNFLATFVAIALVDKLGRRPLMLLGNAIQVTALAVVGYLFTVESVSPVLLLAFVLLFISAFAIAMGPIPWILCSEIFPAKLRGRAMSVATFCIWTGCYAVSLTFPVLLKSVGASVTFWIYGACSLVTFFFVYKIVPETKGRSLEEIEKAWLESSDDDDEFNVVPGETGA